MNPDPSTEQFLRSMQQVLADSMDMLEGAPQIGSIDDIRSYLGELSADEKIEWLARAYTLSLQSETDADLKAKQEEFLHTKDLKEQVQVFERTLQTSFERMHEVVKLVPKLVSASDILTRQTGVVGKNSVATSFDDWTTQFGVEAAAINGFVNALKHFQEEVEKLNELVTKVDILDPNDESFETFRANVMGILEAIDMVRRHVDGFPMFCDELASGIRRFHSMLKSFYKPRDEDNDTGGKGGFFFFGPPSVPVEPPPVYKGNVFLTEFLNNFVTRIPEKQDDKKGKDIEVERGDIMSFARHLLAFADAKLLNQIRTPLLFHTLAEGVEGLHESYSEILNAYEGTGLEAVREKDPRRKANAYTKILQDAQRNALGGSIKEGSAFKAFSPRETVEYLRDLNPSAKERELQQNEEGPDAEQSKREKAYLSMFEKIEEVLERAAEDADAIDEEEMVAFVTELIEIKAEMDEAEVKKRKSQIKQDKMKGNHCFTTKQQDLGELKLERVPSPGKRYEDVKGASWSSVKESLDGLLKFAARSYIYSQMSPRGRINNNMLIIGPYGCGKNMWTKALMSDPATVGINVTYDKLISKWVGQAEQNIRAVFELGAEKWVEYEKPVVIGWDEFDSLFGGKGDRFMGVTDGIKQTMQKILQSVLDGDTIYEGVSLISLTNEPLLIPVPIWRRFAHVEIIQPLTDDERISLMQHMLSWLPTSHDFEQEVDWGGFASRTNFASGDVIAKVYDDVFGNFLRLQEETNPDALEAINKEARERVHEGLSFDPKDCAEIFSRHSSDVVITPSAFFESSKEVLGQRENRNAMRQQKLFYDAVEQRLEEAFSGDI